MQVFMAFLNMSCPSSLRVPIVVVVVVILLVMHSIAALSHNSRFIINYCKHHLLTFHHSINKDRLKFIHKLIFTIQKY